VQPHQVDTAVATSLVFPFRRMGCGPLNMKLAVSEALACPEIPTVGSNLQITAINLPCGWLVILAMPLGQVFATEQHDCVPGRASRLFLSAGFTRGDHRRKRPIPVMNLPIGDRLGSGIQAQERATDDTKHENIAKLD